MLPTLFRMAVASPTRRAGLIRALLIHLGLLGLLVVLLVRKPGLVPGLFAQAVLVLGIVEGAALVGWRLVQIPKSLALEFLLVSLTPPRRFFLAEWTVGAARFLLVQLAGLPLLLLAVADGQIHRDDLPVLLVMPAVWGLFAGTALTLWIYEPKPIRKIGELLGFVGVMLYLVVGVLAAENLPAWLKSLPAPLGDWLLHGILWLHEMNPFGVLRNWFHPFVDREAAQSAFTFTTLAASVAILLFAWRASGRLQGHFQERHYLPIASDRASQLDKIGNAPLAWWAVRRVMEYGGRINLYLAFGVCALYAAFLIDGADWPAWIGRGAFVIFEQWGGPATIATAMTVMACVPAVYQFGLWDATVPDRCRRLELLLLTELEPRDYAQAAFRAAWHRGFGYLLAAAMLWIATAWAGRVFWWDSVAAAVGSLVLWGFSFAVGFHGFTTGQQSNGSASLLTLGAPMLMYLFWTLDPMFAALSPTAAAFLPLKTGLTLPWLAGTTLLSFAAVTLYARTFQRCDGNLRAWYDAHQGSGVVS